MSGTQYRIDASADAVIDPGSRALHYGDGLFETLCVRDGIIEFLDRHMQRLKAGCDRLQLAFTDWSGLATELRQCAVERPDAVVKIILSRGAGARGYRYTVEQGVTRLVSTGPLPVFPRTFVSKGVAVRLCDLRLSPQPRLAGIKHLNRLEQVLARAEWAEEYPEGLLLDYNGQLIEGTMSNLFLVRAGRLYTPRLDNCGVAGVMRSVVLDLVGEQGIEREVGVLSPADLQDAEEVFLCNSLIGIWPVTAVAGQFTGRAGAVTQALQRALAAQDKTAPGIWYSE